MLNLNLLKFIYKGIVLCHLIREIHARYISFSGFTKHTVDLTLKIGENGQISDDDMIGKVSLKDS